MPSMCRFWSQGRTSDPHPSATSRGVVRAIRTASLLVVVAFAGGACSGGAGSGDGSHANGEPAVGSATGTPTADSGAVTFTAYVNGELPASQVVKAHFRGDRLVRSPHSTDLPAWLRVVKNPNDTGQDRRYTFSIATIDLPPGTYTQTITLRDEQDMLIGDELLGTLSFPVTLHVLDDIHVSAQAITFDSVEGAKGEPASQRVSVSGSDASWSASSADPWIRVITPSGTGAGELEIGTDLAGAGLSVGTHRGMVTVVDNGSGDSTSIDVIVRIETRRLVVKKNGLAFSAYAGGGRATQAIAIEVNGTQDSGWRLSNPVRWLTADRNAGTAGEAIEFSVDASGLAAGVHTGIVTLSSDDSQVGNSVDVAVGLYVSEATPEDIVEVEGIAVGEPVDLISDPIRPYVYTVNSDSDVRIYNVYTGAEVTTLSGVGADLRGLAIASDGSSLYAADAGDYSIAVIDLANLSVIANYTGDFFDVCEGCNEFQLRAHNLSLEYTRTNGHPLLITNGHKIVDADDGEVLFDFHPELADDYWCCDHDPSLLAVAASGESFFLQELGVSSHSLIRLDLAYSYLETDPVRVEVHTRVSEAGNARDVAVSPDDERVCTASAGEHEVHCYSVHDLLETESYPAGTGYLSNVAFDMDGNLYVATETSGFGDVDVIRYAGSPASRVADYSVSGAVRERNLVASSDGARLIVRSQGGQYITSLAVAGSQPSDL